MGKKLGAMGQKNTATRKKNTRLGEKNTRLGKKLSTSMIGILENFTKQKIEIK
jgi:hypothetical protein